MKKWFFPLIVVFNMTGISVGVLGQTVMLPEYINTTFEEFQPLVSLDGKRIYFSRRGDKRNVGSSDHADCWYADKAYDGTWMEPINCGMAINNFEDNSLVAINFERSWGLVKDGEILGNFFELQFELNHVIGRDSMIWPKELREFEIVDAHILSEKGIGVLAMREKTKENTDLYIIEKDAVQQQWSPPIAIKGGVNGSGNERFPHLAPDGRTLYFASTSHGGFGGSDIFLTRLEGEKITDSWMIPRNMGLAVNSALDETAPSLSLLDRTLYFVRTLPLKGKDIFSVNLEAALLPNPLALITVRADKPGKLIQSNYEVKGERFPKRDSVFHFIAEGESSSMLTFVGGNESFYPSKIIRAKVNEESLDREGQDFLDAILADLDYKAREIEIQKLQKEILVSREGLKEYGLLLTNQIEGLTVPSTAVFENEGFKTDRTLQDIENKYERFVEKTLAGKEFPPILSISDSSSMKPREERIADLKRQISNQVVEEDSRFSTEKHAYSFLAFRDTVKKEVEMNLFLEVWETLVQDMKTDIQWEVKKKYESESTRNLLKRDLVKDSIPEYWRIPNFPYMGKTYNSALAGDLRRHLEPIIRATMLGLLKEEVKNYLDKVFHMIVLDIIQEKFMQRLEELIVAQKSLEKKVLASLVETKEENLPILPKEKDFMVQDYLEVNWILQPVTFSKHVYFELPAVFFTSNEIQLNHFSRLELNRLVQVLRANPDLSIQILVHTHGYMTYTTADKLTAYRADQIREYLNRAGILSERVEVYGVGKNYPKLANHNFENRRQNQRVEVLIK